MHVSVVTLFPEMFEPFSRCGIVGRALDSQLLALDFVNPRDFSGNRHRTVDDRPYGGGPGMVMQVEPLRGAIQAARGSRPNESRSDDQSRSDELSSSASTPAWTVMLSAQGRRLDHGVVSELVRRRRLILVCGRYEGVDERLVELEVDEELCLGDFVLSGGEVAAMAIVEAAVRLVPGALGHEDSAASDSFANGTLDHPHYTRPQWVDGLSVPEVLLSGDHQAIRQWRLKNALARTWRRRPDLLTRHELDAEQRALLNEIVAEAEANHE